MNQARVNSESVATWVETCFCDPPLAEERPYWEEYFELVRVQDAHSRRNCRHENGTEPWACCDCDCTQKLEEKLRGQGESFLETLRPSKLPRQRHQTRNPKLQRSSNNQTPNRYGIELVGAWDLGIL